MNKKLVSKLITPEVLISLRDTIEITSEIDYGSLFVTHGRHPVAGLVALISSPEASGNILIAENLIF